MQRGEGYHRSCEHSQRQAEGAGQSQEVGTRVYVPDLPTFDEIKAEDRQKTAEHFFARKMLRYFYLPVTQNEPIFSILTSPNSTEIPKLILNNNTSICLCIVFAMTSKVRKKRKNFKINRKGRRFRKETPKKLKIFHFIGRLGRSELFRHANYPSTLPLPYY